MNLGSLCDIESSIVNLFTNLSSSIGYTVLFVLGLVFELAFVLFFMIKSFRSYEMRVTKSIDKLNLWLFENKKLTEENVKEFNTLVKTKSPKRLNHYWQQFILFREGNPSTYLSPENLVEKPLKASGISSNVKNLTLVTCIWAVLMFILGLAHSNTTSSALSIQSFMISLILPFLILLIGGFFIILLRNRKNVNLNTLYQNLSLFDRFLDNACVELPNYIDYQLLFSEQEIQKGIPVLREFLDARAREEKEQFEKERENRVESESYDFESSGVDGSLILERAMKESEIFINKKSKTLALIAQLESEIESRRKNYDNVAKDYQKKLEISKENVDKLRQQQEETTNRIESNFLRKQQTQEIAKQEQLESELDQQTTKFVLEKNEFDAEIKRLQGELDTVKQNAQRAMTGEFQSFYNKFCKSAQMAVEMIIKNKFDVLSNEKDSTENAVVELNKRIKELEADNAELKSRLGLPADEPVDGHYDENGNYVYQNGSFYDPEGRYHDTEGNIFSPEGELLESADAIEKPVEEVNFDNVDFLTDLDRKDDVINAANKIVTDIVDPDHVETEEEETPVEDSVEENTETVETVETEDKLEESWPIENEEQESKVEPVQEVKEPEVETVQEPQSVGFKPVIKEVSVVEPKLAEPVVHQEPVREPQMDEVDLDSFFEEDAQELVEDEPVRPVPQPVPQPAPVVEETPAFAEEELFDGDVDFGDDEASFEDDFEFEEDENGQPKRKAGRPKGTTKVEPKEPSGRKPGRPKGTTKVEPKEPSGRKPGRPKGTTKVEPKEPSGRKPGRPKKEDVNEINQEIDKEENRVKEIINNYQDEIKKEMASLDQVNETSSNEELQKEIDNIKEQVNVAKESKDYETVDRLNKKLEELIQQVKNQENAQ